MGWLDKGLKNIFKGGKELLSSPAGIMALGVLAPYAAPWMKGLGAKQGLGMFGSPMVSNALKNAAMNYGIATLTGSKHPGKAALWAGAASLPFTYMKGAQAAGAYNKAAGLTGADKASWADFATGKIMPGSEYSIPGKTSYQDIISGPQTAPQYDQSWAAEFAGPTGYTDIPDSSQILGTREIMGAPTTGTVPDMPYFTRGLSGEDTLGLEMARAGSSGLGSMVPGLGLENVDVMAALVPQVAGLYGGRMSEEERWLASQEKQIRMWAFQFGIPYEEAKEIWKDGWKNPYYTTKTPEEYGSFRNRGGYIDDYTAGGKAVGPGTGKSDSIQPVALSNGEFVFTEKATNNFPGGADGLYSLMNRLDPESETPTEARA